MTVLYTDIGELVTNDPTHGDGDPLGRGADAIADARKIGERGGAFDDADPSAAPARLIGRRLGPEPDPGAGKARPIKQFAGVALPFGGDVGMADDPVRRDPPARQDIAAQLLDGRHLRFGKRTISPFVAGIDDLDAD